MKCLKNLVDILDKNRYNIVCSFVHRIDDQTQSNAVEGGNNMSEIRLKDHESLDSALRRFKRSCAKDGVLSEIRKREHYEKPSVKRKKKSEAARKRKFK